MAITHRSPNTIYLGGEITKLNEHILGVAGTPGMVLEFYTDGTVTKLRPHSSADEVQTAIVLLEKTLHNEGITGTYAIGELAYAAHFHPGSSFYGIAVSGQNIQAGEYLQSNGDGKLKVATATTATAGLAKFQSQDNLGLIATDTRIRVSVVM
jgi:hypothetical protein